MRGRGLRPHRGVAEAVVLDPCGVVAAVEDADDEVLGEAFGRVVVARSRLWMLWYPMIASNHARRLQT